MPKYNVLANDEEDIELEMTESLDEGIGNQIFQQENLEKNVSAFEVEYKKDKHVYKKEDAYGANLDKYSDLLEYGVLEGSSEFIKSMKLEKGLLNVEADPSLFNKAVMDVMKWDFKRRVTRFETSKKTDLEVNKEKNSYKLVKAFDKKSIIERAKELRAECFNLLTGEGNPERANPKFVKEITEVDKDGNKTTRLAYNEKAIKKLVNSFESDKDLYKSAIANIKTSNFHNYYNNMAFKITMDEDGNEVQKFGFDTKETACEAAEKFAKDYLSLKEIHNSRPWHYWFTHPLENIFENQYLTKIHDTLVDTAKSSGFGKEMKAVLDKSNKKNVNEKLSTLKNAIAHSYKEEASKDTVVKTEVTTKEEIKENAIVEEKRVHIEIEANLIDPVSDVKDELHPFEVQCRGMSEGIEYLTEDQFKKEFNIPMNPSLA